MSSSNEMQRSNKHALRFMSWLLLLLLALVGPQGYAKSKDPAKAQAKAQTGTLNRIMIQLNDEDAIKVWDYFTKWDLKGARVQINDGPWEEAAGLHMRGRSCLLGVRKCYALKLHESVRLNGPDAPKGKSFNLVSMRLDEGYISSRLGFEIFRALGMFDIKAEYAEVFINGHSYGLYMVTEKPEKAIGRISDKAYIGRRGYGASLETKEVPEETGLEEADYINDFADLYADINRLQGKALEERMSERMDLDQYLKWLLVNSALINGDYSDEVFFYAEKTDSRLAWRIFPWDFDDLFKEAHASAENKARINDIQTGLLYNFENPMDVRIHDDPVLKARLKATAREFFAKELTPELVKSVFAKVEAAITPYLDHPSALNAARWDDPAANGKPYTKQAIRDILADRQNRVLNRLEVLKSRAK